MNTAILRLLWSVVSETSPDYVSGLSEDNLVKSLVNQISDRGGLNADEAVAVESYLQHKRTLVLDIVQG